jgi:hypothetical protein
MPDRTVVQSVTTARFGGSRFSSGLGVGSSSGRRSGSGSRMSGVHVGASTGGSSVGSGLGGKSILRVFRLGVGFCPSRVARRCVWRRKGLSHPLHHCRWRQRSWGLSAPDQRPVFLLLELNVGTAASGSLTTALLTLLISAMLPSPSWPTTNREICSARSGTAVRRSQISTDRRSSPFVDKHASFGNPSR